MSLKLVALLLSLAGIFGLGIGYYLRFIISLGKKGSMEIEIKEMLLAAKEEAKKITADAINKAEKNLEVARREIKEKEEKNQNIEIRLLKKEDLLDKKQADVEKEVELVKERVAEIKNIKEKVEKLESEKIKELGLLGEHKTFLLQGNYWRLLQDLPTFSDNFLYYLFWLPALLLR